MRRLGSPHSSNTKCMKTEINLFGTKYKIKFVDEPMSLDDNGERYAYGQAVHTEFEIIIPTKTVKGKPIPKYDLQKNICHEIVHCIFSEGGYTTISEDEPLVEWTARCIYELFLKQNIFEL